MYAFIAGRLEDPGPPTVVSTGGIGFEIWVPERHRLRLPERGSSIRLFTHLQGREDGLTLYGFGSPGERELFRTLLGVSGIGPKVALAILGAEDADLILTELRQGDLRRLIKVKGVGRKTAERLLVELRDKDIAPPALVAVAGGDAGTPVAEAALVLQGMGLPPDDARAALAALDENAREKLSVQDLVRHALRRVQL